MLKPKGYETTQAAGAFEKLQPGGHVCKIIKVEEALSKTGRDMIKIYLDIAEGEQANYFGNIYKNNTKDGKKWPCIVYRTTENDKGECNPWFKQFTDKAEESNQGFRIVWGDSFCDSLKGKLIGAIFGEEEYINSNNEKRIVVKCQRFVAVDEARAGIEPPEIKRLQEQPVPEGFYPIDEGIKDDDLPF